MKTYEIFGLDTETTGLSPFYHSPVEISIYRLSNNTQKTWHLKPVSLNTIEPEALRVNGLKIEDLRGDTKEGHEKYRDPAKVLVEIESWLAEDFLASNDRIIAAQNAAFDKGMLESLWEKCGTKETFPFNRKYTMDTAMVEFYLDWCKGQFAEGYSLHALTKKYGVKNLNAHSAEADTKATVEVLKKQIEYFRTALNR